MWPFMYIQRSPDSVTSACGLILIIIKQHGASTGTAMDFHTMKIVLPTTPQILPREAIKQAAGSIGGEHLTIQCDVTLQNPSEHFSL